MRKILFAIMLALATGCGESDSNEGKSTNPPSAPNHHKPSPAELDIPINYFSVPGHRIRIVKKFEFGWSSSHYRGQSFYNGRKLQANELTGDGRSCTISQPLTTSDIGPILVQQLASYQPITRETIEDLIPDDFRFAGIKFDFSIVAGGFLYCTRQESLGPVTMQDFRDHFNGYIEFSE